MNKEDKKLLNLCISAFEDSNLDKKQHQSFRMDYAKYLKGELTFRELVTSIVEPAGELQEALKGYYNRSAYTPRVFKKK